MWSGWVLGRGGEAIGFCEDLGSLGGLSGKGVSVFVEGVAVVPADPFPLDIGVSRTAANLLDGVSVLDPLTPPRTARCQLAPCTQVDAVGLNARLRRMVMVWFR